MLYGEYLPKRVLQLSEYSNECVEIDLHWHWENVFGINLLNKRNKNIRSWKWNPMYSELRDAFRFNRDHIYCCGAMS